MMRTKYDSVLQNNNITATNGSQVATYRTLMRRVNLTNTGPKGGALYKSTSHTDYLRVRTLRKIL